MLPTPAELSIWAKLRSAAAASKGIPSNSNRVPETPSITPDFPSGGWAAHSSFHAALNCSEVRVWSHPYRRGYLIMKFKLRGKKRTDRELQGSNDPRGEPTMDHLPSK